MTSLVGEKAKRTPLLISSAIFMDVIFRQRQKIADFMKKASMKQNDQDKT